MDLYGLEETDVLLLLKLVEQEIMDPSGSYSQTGNPPERGTRLGKLKNQLKSILLHQNQGR